MVCLRYVIMLISILVCCGRGLTAAADSVVVSGMRHVGSTVAAPETKASFSLVECADDGGQDRNKVICILVKVTNDSSTLGTVSCRALHHRENRKTPYRQNIQTGSGQSKAVDCSGAQSCQAFIQDDVRSDSDYDVFCVNYNHSVGYEVEPECKEGSKTCGLQVSTSAKFHNIFGAEDFFATLLLMVYIGWSFFFERIRILHETGFAVIIGVLCGLALKFTTGRTAQFNYNLFSYFLLPMVIFAAGFNMRKKNFFRYFGYIITLGVTGTVLIFVVIYIMSGHFSFKTFAGDALVLEPHHLLVMASVLSSTDSVAPMAFLPSTTFPALYAVVFGEGVLNDVVSILLSKSVEGSSKLPSFFELVGNIAYFFSTSLAMGAAFGFPVAFLFRQAQVLREETVKPCALLMLLNYACYVIAEICDISSIFALFVCALISNHYARHSLSKAAEEFTTEVSEFFCYMAEAFVFGYFGLTAVTYLSDPKSFSLDLILCYSASVILARALAVFMLVFGLRLLRCGGQLALGNREWCLVAFAGCMRGTIAYALILKAMPPQEYQNPTQTILVSTVLGIVLINCLVFGGLFPVMLWLLGIKARSPGRQTSCTSEVNAELPQVDATSGSASAATSSPIMSTLQNALHPTEIRWRVDRWWHYIDGRWLRPYFRPANNDLGSTLEEPEVLTQTAA